MSNARNLANLLGTGTQITTADIADGAFQANKNLIINGSQIVAQRDTSGTSTADIYTMDRFALGHGSPVNAMTFEQSTDVPDNFKNSLKITAGTGASASTTGYAILRQAIEGQNISHLGFGTSAAKALTLSFWVKSSLTGTFGVSVRNQAGTRAYGGTYSISSANTWEYVTVSIPADTSGTWPTNNGIGLHLFWDLGAGSNYDIAAGSWTNGSNMFGVESTVKLTETTGATFNITGVQIEVGEQATPFEHRSFGDELARCQRYYEHSYPYGTAAGAANGGIGAYHIHAGALRANFYGFVTTRYTVQKRASATVTVYSYGGTSGQISNGDSGANIGAASVIQNGATSFLIRNNSGGTLSDQPIIFHYSGDAEL